jgi:hypothetical protein
MGYLGFNYRMDVITPFVAPPAEGLSSPMSRIQGVDNAGDLVGEYSAAGVNPAGYLSRNGVLTTIAFPDPAATQRLRSTPGYSVVFHSRPAASLTSIEISSRSMGRCANRVRRSRQASAATKGWTTVGQ